VVNIEPRHLESSCHSDHRDRRSQQHHRKTEPAVPTYVPCSDECDLHDEQNNPAGEDKRVDPEDERSGDRGVQQVLADGVGKPVADNSCD
jgi:hypothetical protein